MHRRTRLTPGYSVIETEEEEDEAWRTLVKKLVSADESRLLIDG